MDISFVYRKLRRSVAGFTILAMLTSFVSFTGVAQAATCSFPDVDEDHWAIDYICDLVAQEVISGYENGEFGPEDSLTRGELAKIAVLAFLGEEEIDTEYDAGFLDVGDEWFADYVNTAAKHGIVGGYTDAEGDPTGYYGPFDHVNRAAAAKILVGAAGLLTDTTGAPHFDDVEEGTWYYDFVETAYNNTILDGYEDGTYGPADDVTRAQISKMSVNAQNPVTRPQEEEPDPDENDDDDGVGVLTLEVISGDGGTVPKSATAVPMLGLELMAEDDDMTFNSLVVDREGVGSTNDFSNLYFYHDAERIGSGHSISSDTNEATFNSLGVSVEDGDTEVVWIKADISSSATASNENFLSVESEDAVEVSGGDVDGDFPLDGPVYNIGGSTAGTITIEKNSTVSSPTIGETDAEIADFKLSATSEDMTLEQLALTFKGTIAAEGGANFKLLQNGEVLAETDTVSGNEIFTFVLDTPYEIENGDTRVFTVTAEITSSADPSDTIQVYLDESTDLVAVGDVYGYGATVTSTAYDNSAADGTDANHSTVQGGQFTVAFNGPPVFNFPANADDLSFLDLTFTAGRDVEVRQLTFTIAATGSGLVDADGATANYTDIKLVDSTSGSTLMGPKELSVSGSDSSQSLVFTDSWYLDAGETVDASLTMNVANETTLDDTPSVVTVTMAAISTTEGVKDSGTGEFLTDIVPGTSIVGYGHTAQDASLSVAVASSPVSDTIVKGTAEASLAAFNFTAGAASDVVITKIQPTVDFSLEDSGAAGTWSTSGSTGSTTYAKDLVTTLYLYDENGDQIGTAEAVPNAGKPTFDGFELTVPAGETITVTVKGDIATTAPAEGTTDVVGVDIEATGDVTAEDMDNNTVTLSAAEPNGSTDTNATTVAMTISSGGSIVVSDPASQENDKLVSAGDTEVFVGRMKVKATDEDFNVTKVALYVTNSGSEDSVAKLKIKYPTDLAAPTTLDGSKEVTMSGTAVTFDNLDFMVPRDNDNVVFEVYANVNSHADDGGAADTGDNLQVTLYPYDTAFEATGEGSGVTKDGDDSSVIAAAGVSTNKPYVFKSTPSVALSGTTAGTLVTGSQKEVYRFAVTADNNGDIALLQLKLDVSSSGIATDSTGLGGVATSNARGQTNVGIWEMFEVSGGSVQFSEKVGSGEYVHSGTFYEGGEEVYMEVYDDITNWAAGSGAFERVSSNTTQTYAVTTTLTDDGTNNTNSISVRIANDSAADHNNTAVATVGTPLAGDLISAGFVWSDRPNASSFGTSAAMWHNGYKVVGLPTSYVSYTADAS
ncbi:MAG: S-layer homology domain-containing protein [Patescibacteria group bacterium]